LREVFNLSYQIWPAVMMTLECRYRHEACQNWRAPHVSRWGSLPHRRLVLCGCGYAPLCENLQASAALQSSPYLTTGQPVRRCLRAQAVARSQIVHSCVQAGLGPISLNSMGDAIGWPSIRMPAFGRSDISSRRSICAQLFAVLVTIPPLILVAMACDFIPACRNGKTNRFLLELKNDTA